MLNNSSQLLPPKMLKSYYDRAMAGDYQYKISPGIYIWFVGQQKITVLGEHTGTVAKLTARELESEKHQLAQYKKI